MSQTPFQPWSERLRLAAARTPRAPGVRGAGFSDEMGHRRAVDGPFLAWRAAASGRASPAPAPGGGGATDVQLWRAVLDPSMAVEPLISVAPGAAAAPVTAPEPIGAIEVWTETELCSLHALWRLGRERQRGDLLRRCLCAAEWHVEHLQPDNATNHPWAIHVFIIAAARLGRFEHELHAQAMLHNCQVSLGRPDALSAHILVDAAECLDQEDGDPG